jgi:hypothetical protein
VFVLIHARANSPFQVTRAFRTAPTLQPLTSNFRIFCLLRTLCTLAHNRMSRKPFEIKMIRTLAKTTEGVPRKRRTTSEDLCALPLNELPLFSTTSTLLFSQLLSFHIHTKIPGGWGVERESQARSLRPRMLSPGRHLPSDSSPELQSRTPASPQADCLPQASPKSDDLTHMESHSNARPRGEGVESLNVPTSQRSNVITSSALPLYFLTSLLLSFSHA